MATTTTRTNKPLNPRAQDLSPKGYNRASLYSGKALDFDGVNDKVEGSAPSLPTGANPFTTCFYYKETTTSREAFFWGGLSNNQSNGYRTATNKFKHFFYSNDLESTIETPIGTWVFAVVTFDGTTRSIYINGQLDVSDTPTGVNVTGTNYKVGVATTSYWNGNISNIRVFNTALTAAQVADLYLNPEKIVPDGIANSALKLWLPMMEGAGTTAYDGSGNGNHGTISGATWTSGIGAPVAQTALVGWNKGTNLLPYSEQFDQWTQTDSSVSDNVESAPNGTTTADKWVIDSGQNSTADIRQNISSSVGQDYLLYVFAKAGEFSKFQLDTSNSQFSDVNVDFDLSTGSIVSSGGDNVTEGIIDKGNGWYLCYMVGTAIAGSGSFIIRNDATQTGDGSKGMYLWGGGYVQASDITTYIPTIDATAQTSPVLLPQGLTANKDITGVNSVFRNAYALNLDGKSWAEVHDNASLDITDAITLECWFYDTDSGAFSGVIGKWKDTTQRTYAIIKNNGSNNFLLRISTDGSAQAGPTITNTNYGWIHLVLTYDGANVKGYKNGVYQSQAALTGSIATNDLPVEIGRYGQSTGSQYDNQIALPRIYNRALTATEVARNYNADRSKFGL